MSGLLFNDHFSGVAAGYATFRFLVEFVRGNEMVVMGLSRPQLFLLACAPLLTWHVVRQMRRGVYFGRRTTKPIPEVAA